jgi:glycosyltransferase involved in cell wall biosynthesis
MGMKRILTCYYRPKPGGFCKRLFRAINALLDDGHVVHYLAVVRFPVDHPNCHFHRFPWPEKYTSGYVFWLCFYLSAPLQLLYLGFRYRVQNLFAFGHSYALFLQPLRLFKQIPLSVFLRADTIRNHKINQRPDWLIYLECLLEGGGIWGTRMYGVSESLVNATRGRHRVMLPAQSGLLRNEIEQIYRKEKSKKVQLPLRLGCVGVLEARKNQKLLLKVMEEINKDQAQLFLYGTGPDEPVLRAFVQEKELLDRIHFMGWVPADRIWDRVDVLLMPSLHEGAPNSVLEALAAGVVVLASDISEHAEILAKGNLIPLSGAAEWRERIRSFLTDPDLQAKRLVQEQEAAVH